MCMYYVCVYIYTYLILYIYMYLKVYVDMFSSLFQTRTIKKCPRNSPLRSQVIPLSRWHSETTAMIFQR